jgi:hypothetical protein
VSSAGVANNFEHTGGVAYGRSGETDVQGIAGSSRGDPAASAFVQSPSGAPANPFAKTLAIIEPQERESGELVGNSKGAWV